MIFFAGNLQLSVGELQTFVFFLTVLIDDAAVIV